MLNAGLVTGERPGVVAIRVYPEPRVLMFKAEKVATPLTVTADTIPLRIPPTGLIPIARLIGTFEAGTIFPLPSSILTATAGLIQVPGPESAGGMVNTKRLSALKTVNAELVAPERPELVAVNVYPVPAALMLRPENVAIPLTALVVNVPVSRPLPGLAPMDNATELFAEVTVLPNESSIATVTAGVIGVPILASAGWLLNPTWDGTSMSGSVATALNLRARAIGVTVGAATPIIS